MSLSSKIRHRGFWLADAINGYPIQRDLGDIKKTFEIEKFSELQKKNEPILQTLLSAAVESTDFYRSLKSYKCLQDFPVVNKQIIKNNFNEINILPIHSPNVFEKSSSGSTGTPFKVGQTKRKQLRNKADALYFANRAGYNVGDQLLFIRLWMKKYRKSALYKKLSNIVEIDVVNDLTDANLKVLIKRLIRDKQRKGIIGYPSGFEKICKYLDNIESKPLNCNIKSIIATSEPLYDYVRQKMEYYFQSPIVSRYSNEENGILAQQNLNQTEFTINWASYHIEILNMHNDKPVKPGEMGRIVVTDLYNLATPLIRYDTGDLGKFSNFKNDDIPHFAIINGRKSDILYDTSGRTINVFVVHQGIMKFPELNQLQIIQQDRKSYTLKLNSNIKLQREDELISYFKNYLGNDAMIYVEYVNEIPLLNSGKRRIVVNLYR